VRIAKVKLVRTDYCDQARKVCTHDAGGPVTAATVLYIHGSLEEDETKRKQSSSQDSHSNTIYSFVAHRTRHLKIPRCCQWSRAALCSFVLLSHAPRWVRCVFRETVFRGMDVGGSVTGVVRVEIGVMGEAH